MSSRGNLRLFYHRRLRESVELHNIFVYQLSNATEADIKESLYTILLRWCSSSKSFFPATVSWSNSSNFCSICRSRTSTRGSWFSRLWRRALSEKMQERVSSVQELWEWRWTAERWRQALQANTHSSRWCSPDVSPNTWREHNVNTSPINKSNISSANYIHRTFQPHQNMSRSHFTLKSNKRRTIMSFCFMPLF